MTRSSSWQCFPTDLNRLHLICRYLDTWTSSAVRVAAERCCRCWWQKKSFVVRNPSDLRRWPPFISSLWSLFLPFSLSTSWELSRQPHAHSGTDRLVQWLALPTKTTTKATTLSADAADCVFYPHLLFEETTQLCKDEQDAPILPSFQLIL